jgi:predicted regulator of amino acid metabolism with ACT domain
MIIGAERIYVNYQEIIKQKLKTDRKIVKNVSKSVKSDNNLNKRKYRK